MINFEEKNIAKHMNLLLKSIISSSPASLFYLRKKALNKNIFNGKNLRRFISSHGIE